MEKLSTFTFSPKAYCLLTKPGIIAGNLITTAAGFFLATQEKSLLLFLSAMCGLACIIASGCVLNNCIDRAADAKMQRTKHRASWFQQVSVQNATAFALLLGTLGTWCLFTYTNLLTTAVALFGFFTYVALYTYSKYRTVHGTLIGSIAGAVPPVVGYTAVSNTLDAGAWILFLMLVLWQMPHFYAIAMYRHEDYEAAGIPVLPVEKGIRAAKVQMVGYMAGFVGACWLLAWCGYVGTSFVIASTLLSAAWFSLGIQGFWCKNDTVWARKMFICSLVVILGVSGLIIL